LAKTIKLIKITRWIMVLLTLFAIATIFFPFARETMLDGTIVEYPTLIAVFGGEFAFSDASYDYTMSFSLNLWLVIAYQFALLSSLAFFSSARKKTNLIFGTILAFISMIAMIFMPFVVSFSTPGFVLEGIAIAYGPILGASALLAAEIIALFHILSDIRYHK